MIENHKTSFYPFFNLFLQLKTKYSLQLQDYLSFFKVFRNSFEIKNKDDLKTICKLLWLKKHEDYEISWFNDVFDVEFENELKNFKLFLNKFNFDDKQQQNNTKNPDIPDKNLNSQNKENEDNTNPDELQNNQNKNQEISNISDTEYQELYMQITDTKSDNSLESERKKLLSEFNFTFSKNNFYPIQERPLQITVRNLRDISYISDFNTIDTNECAENIAKNKYLTEIKYQTEIVNNAKAVVIIDILGSMSVFKYLSRQVADIISSQIDTEIYYSYNLQTDFMYSDIKMTKEIKWEKFDKTAFNGKYVILISDAGAAKGNYSSERIDKSKVLLTEIGKYAKNIVWLNPMPRYRWRKSSAIYISLLVKMFDISNDSLPLAIQYLKNNNKILNN